MKRTDRKQLQIARRDVGAWVDLANATLRNTRHLPISRLATVTQEDAELLNLLAQVSHEDLKAASELTDTSWFGLKEPAPAVQEASRRILAVHQKIMSGKLNERLIFVHEWYANQLREQRAQLDELISLAIDNGPKAQSILTDTSHHIPGPEYSAPAIDVPLMTSFVDAAEFHSSEARALSNSMACSKGSCDQAHASAQALAAFAVALAELGGTDELESIRFEARRSNQAARTRLEPIIERLSEQAALARKPLFLAEHLPVRGAVGSVSDDVIHLRSLVDLVDQNEQLALALLDRANCVAETCGPSHIAAKNLIEVDDQVPGIGNDQSIADLATLIDQEFTEQCTLVTVALTGIEQISSRAAKALRDLEHLPLARGLSVSAGDIELLRNLVNQSDLLAEKARQLVDSGCTPTAPCVAHHDAARQICATYEALDLDTIEVVARSIHSHYAEEQAQVTTAFNTVEQHARASALALSDLDHMPLSREVSATSEDTESLRQVVQLFESYETDARRVFTPEGDSHPTSEVSRVAARALCDAYEFIDFARIEAHTAAIRSRYAAERADVRQTFDALSNAAKQYKQTLKRRATAGRHLRANLAAKFQAATPLRIRQEVWQLVPIVSEDHDQFADLWFLRDTAGAEAASAIVDRASAFSGARIEPLHPAFDSKWKCKRNAQCEFAHSQLPEVYSEAQSIWVELRGGSVTSESIPDMADLLDPSLKLLGYATTPTEPVGIVEASQLDGVHASFLLIRDAAKAARTAGEEAREAAGVVRDADVATVLKQMDLEVLRNASKSRIRTGALQEAGISNVWDVLRFDRKGDLQYLPGIGSASAQSIMQAALRLLGGIRDETPVRIEVKKKLKRTVAMLERLRDWDSLRHFEPSKDDRAIAKALLKVRKSEPDLTHVFAVRLSESDHRSVEGRTANRLAEAIQNAVADTPGAEASSQAADVWEDFLSRPATYFALLTELGFLTEDEAKMHGDLPQEIIDAVRAKDLKRDHLTASLRAYQSFGARFALVQQKVIIGDEMGLGKTVEALAAIAHLKATGHSHFLVLCPAAVISNWTREISKHTTMRSHRLHGSPRDREAAARQWVRDGGIAVTTFDLLHWSSDYLRQVELTCAVLDEAHYIKNPEARRSQAAAQVIADAKYVIMMTGTPLENRVSEFSNLVDYIRPDLASTAPEYLPSKFRKHVAPAYLRRNQEDVLTELPDLIEVDDWMQLSGSDTAEYREAVEAGHFMRMRRAAMLNPDSTKFGRLLEIVEEAEANNRRVIVFSYFRDVLAQVAAALPGQVFGPLTGSVQAAQRQRLVDDFTAAPGGAALVAQITAGGVGLNIQSASVVVICEPQLKPTLEAQAIARAHRMGQTQSVQVHRLLTEDSVDERIREILTKKRELFDSFARDSVIANRAPDAVDISDAELAREVIAAERERLFGATHQTPQL